MTSRPGSFLIVTAGTLRCALPIDQVREVMRPLPVKPLGGAVPEVLGAAVVRGLPLAVLSLSDLLRQPRGNESRFVVLKTPGRDCVLAVDSIEQMIQLEEHEWQKLPALLQDDQFAERIAAFDQDLIVTLHMGRLVNILPSEEEVVA